MGAGRVELADAQMKRLPRSVQRRPPNTAVDRSPCSLPNWAGKTYRQSTDTANAIASWARSLAPELPSMRGPQRASRAVGRVGAAASNSRHTASEGCPGASSTGAPRHWPALLSARSSTAYWKLARVGPRYAVVRPPCHGIGGGLSTWRDARPSRGARLRALAAARGDLAGDELGRGSCAQLATGRQDSRSRRSSGGYQRMRVLRMSFMSSTRCRSSVGLGSNSGTRCR